MMMIMMMMMMMMMMICLLCLFADEFTEKLENFKNQTPAMSEHQLTTARDIRRRGEGGFKYQAILLILQYFNINICL